jgi:dihydrodipicolinate reductase
MIKVAVGGATGKLGKMVCDLISISEDMELSGALVSQNGGNVGRELYPGVFATGPDSLKKTLENTDVYVDLTSPEAASGIIADIPSTGTNVVLGTTAVPNDILNKMSDNVRRCGTSAIVSANFSRGVNVFWKMCGEMAKYLSDYDIEIIEAHHSAKRDAPSGTASETLRRLQSSTGIEKVVNGREGAVGARTREIGVHVIRAGDIIGDNTVIFAKNMERLEIAHKAVSRETFARGCIDSVRWVADKKDGLVHNMDEVFGI